MSEWTIRLIDRTEGDCHCQMMPTVGGPMPPLKRHWAALDGLRAIAVFGVLMVHLPDPDFFRGGYLGVDVFFVLSGFLITSLLLASGTSGKAASTSATSTPGGC